MKKLQEILEGKKTFISLAVLLLGLFNAGDVIAKDEVAGIINALFEILGFAGAIYGRLVAKVEYKI